MATLTQTIKSDPSLATLARATSRYSRDTQSHSMLILNIINKSRHPSEIF